MNRKTIKNSMLLALTLLSVSACQKEQSEPIDESISSSSKNKTTVSAINGGTYSIISRNGGKAIEVSGASTANGGDVIQWFNSGASNQKWTVNDLGNGYYSIINVNSGLAMDVTGSSTANGGDIIQWAYSGNTNQQWAINNLGNGYFSVINRNSGKSLDIEGASTADGANAVQWTYNGTNNQQFSFTGGGTSTINSGLVTAGATSQANKVYQFLRNNYGQKIISGVMTLNSFDETNWLKANTGKEPAILGLDFMHVNRGYNWYNNNTPTNDAKAWWDKNGIPVLIWHWRDPSRQTEEFYKAGTSFDVNKIFDVNSSEYQAMISDIDYVSGLLKTLQNQGVPVIWRPLHEAAGGWFWWGAKGAAPCKKLYQVMYDRMVNYHGLKNLIWVWTREPNDTAWYPGDQYVDIAGRDIYATGNHSSQLTEFNSMNTLYGGKKMLALTETGSFPDPDNLISDVAKWSWFMPWYGDYTRNSTHNSLDLWRKTLNHSYVITLDEMPSLK